MPLFEIANAQFSFQYPLCSLRAQTPYHDKPSSVSFTFGNEHSFACTWKSLDKLEKVNFNVVGIDLRRCRCRLLIKAVATTLEPKSLASKEDERFGSKDLELGLSPNPPEVLLESSNEESEEIDERERVRRMRISKANKGQTAWNKGRKHSAETLQKIKERTWLAMQNPKASVLGDAIKYAKQLQERVCANSGGAAAKKKLNRQSVKRNSWIKMKLAKHRHAQTTETRRKIGAGVKMRCKRRREKMVVQETCFLEWQNLLAEASRQGYVGQEELQWNSYETLDEKLKLEWLASVKQRKEMPREPGSKRASKTPEHRRKIAEAIKAKWADPEYCYRVCSAMIKHHGTEGAERKPRKRPSDGAQSTRRNPIVKMDADTCINVKSSTKILDQIWLKKSKSPAYKDPLVSSKLEMITNIRVQRAAEETELTKTIKQARLLIAEAEKAAKALEVAARKSPIAQASLLETRKLIAEAIQSLEFIDAQGIAGSDVPSVASSEEKDAEFEVPNQSHKETVNGHKTLSSTDYKFSKDFGKFSLQKLVNGDSELHLTSINGCAPLPVGFDDKVEESTSSNHQRETEQDQSSEYKTDPSPTVPGIQSIKDETQPRSPIVTKKMWVCGRLVEVVEEKQ